MSEVPKPQPGGAAAQEAESRVTRQARVILLRHGEPDWNPGGGPSVEDPGLTPFGWAQARAAAARLASATIDAIYVSPYRRSQETASALAEATGVAPVTIEALAEVGIAVTGLTQEEVDRYLVDGSRRPLNEHWEGWPGAETFHEFHARISAAIREVMARHHMFPTREHDFTVWELPERKENVVIVAHGGTNAVALAHLLDIRPVPWEWVRFESELCAFSVLRARSMGVKGSVWSLHSFNHVEHLKHAGLRES